MEPDAYVEMEQLQDRHWWFRARRRILADQLASLKLAGPARVLEIGSGPGGNLEMLSRFGEVSAVEMSEEARRLAARRCPGARIAYGRLPEEFPFEGETFDLIVMFDVIEHIEDDGRAMASLRQRLAPGGRLVVTAPAYQWLWSEHDVRLHHFRRYTLPQLRNVLSASGWDVERATYFNSLLFPLAAAARVLDNVRKAKAPAGMGLPPAPVGALFEAIFSSERFWLRRFGFPCGLSLLALAK